MARASRHGVWQGTCTAGIVVVCLLLWPASGAWARAEQSPVSQVSTVTLVVSGGNTYDPFHSLVDGQPTGFDVDLLRAVARIMGLDINIDLQPWRIAREGLADGSVDFHIGMTVSPERAETYRFSTPYLVQQYKIFIREETSDIHGEADLPGHRIIVQQKGAVAPYLRHRGYGENLILANDATEALRLLATGNGDCLVMSEFRGLHVLQELGLRQIRPVGNPLYQTRYGYAVPPANENLIPLLNQGLAIVKKSGEYDRLYEAWFGMLQPRPLTSLDYMRYAGRIILPLALVLALVALWSWSLRRKVITRTAQLSRARDAAEAASRTKSRFLATMSHEIRTPLNGVMGMGEFLMDSGLNQTQLEYARTINSSARDLQCIIDNILDFSKIEAGERILVRKNFSPTTVLTEAMSDIRSGAARKGLKLKTVLSRRLPVQVTGDAEALRQVLQNILGNAVKFTPTGAVELAADCEDESPDLVRLVITVSDTGIGVPPAARAGLFDAFTQADSSSSRPYAGTGLGLAISRHLLQQMDGHLEYQDRDDGGSIFRFSLVAGRVVAPAREQKDSPWAPVTPAAEAAWDPSRHTILVVEDNPMNQRVITLMLKAQGFPFEVAENGLVAVEACRQRTFSAILMDCQMPVMDGLEATRTIRKLEGDTRHTPIIALTAGAYQADRKSCLEIGMDDYMSKPATGKIVADLLKYWTNTQVEPALP